MALKVSHGESTGIYRPFSVAPQSMERAEDIKEFLDHLVTSHDLETMLNNIEAHARGVLLEKGVDWRPVPNVIASDSPATIKAASDVMWILTSVRLRLEKIQDEETKNLVIDAIRLGRLDEMLGVRPFEPLVLEGKARRQQYQKAYTKGLGARCAATDLKKRDAKIVRDWQDERKSNPGLTAKAIDERIGIRQKPTLSYRQIGRIRAKAGVRAR